MKCFNHPDRDAVATCQKCGKGLCRECAEKHTPCLCDPCAVQMQQDKQEQAKNKEEQRKQKYRAALVGTRSEFIKTVLTGILVGALGTWWMARDGGLNGFGTYLVTFFIWFCVPFGWKFLTFLQSFFPIFLLGTLWFWIVYGIVKLFLSIFAAIPAFIFQLVRTILTQRKINKLK